MRILHINIGTKVGGAERMLQRLVLDASSEQHEHIVLSMIDIGPVGEALQAEGIRVETLGMRQGVVSIVALLKLVSVVRAIAPDIVIGWMYHGALASLVARVVCKDLQGIIWNVRHSLESLQSETFKTRLILKVLRRYSHIPKQLVFNSQRSLQQHKQFGFDVGKALVIPNGFDPGEFYPDADEYRAVRSELGIADNAFVVGYVARCHWVKGYQSYLQIVQRVTSQLPHVVFVWAGRDATTDNKALAAAMPVLPNASQLILLGERPDVARLYRSFDTLVLSSVSEGFPNVLGEAMLSGVHCVTSDVGDASVIVGQLGVCCEVGDVEAMTAAIVLAAQDFARTEKRIEHGQRCRARIEGLFSMQEVIKQYEAAYRRACMVTEP